MRAGDIQGGGLGCGVIGPDDILDVLFCVVSDVFLCGMSRFMMPLAFSLEPRRQGECGP